MKILIKNGLVVTVNKNDEIKKMDILIENDEIKFIESIKHEIYTDSGNE